MANNLRCISIAILFFVGCDNWTNNEKSGQALWEKMGQIDSAGAASFIIDPSDNFYVGSFDGLYKSTDYGKTWNKLTITVPDSDQDFRAVAIDKNGNLLAGDNWYLLRTTDQGQTWSILYSSDRLSSYIGTIGVNGDTLFVAQNRGLWSRSTDNGLTWSQTEHSSDGIHGMVWANDGRILAGTHYGGGIHRSADNGATWQGLRSGVNWSMAKTSNGHIFAGTEGEGVLRSTDIGDTWESTGPDTPSIFTLAVTPDNHILATGESGNVYFSTDAGQTWIDKSDNLQHESVWGMGIDSHGYVYIVTDIQDLRPYAERVTRIYRARLDRLIL